MVPRKSSVNRLESPKLVGLSNAFNRPEADSLDDVYDHIFASIVDQRLPPGTKLNELTLCEIFNIGRRQIGQGAEKVHALGQAPRPPAKGR